MSLNKLTTLAFAAYMPLAPSVSNATDETRDLCQWIISITNNDWTIEVPGMLKENQIAKLETTEINKNIAHIFQTCIGDIRLYATKNPNIFFEVVDWEEQYFWVPNEVYELVWLQLTNESYTFSDWSVVLKEKWAPFLWNKFSKAITEAMRQWLLTKI